MFRTLAFIIIKIMTLSFKNFIEKFFESLILIKSFIECDLYLFLQKLSEY